MIERENRRQALEAIAAMKGMRETGEIAAGEPPRAASASARPAGPWAATHGVLVVLRRRIEDLERKLDEVAAAEARRAEIAVAPVESPADELSDCSTEVAEQFDDLLADLRSTASGQ